MLLGQEEFQQNKMLKLLTFSFLQGCDLYHKIALLNKATRQSLPGAGILDQGISLTMKTMPENIIDLPYAL